ncbi:MAG: hypothetical protein WC307_01780 [Candidatus Nanoarchaeia archaeon]|jgi:Leucine-rich repeat (LRR) protein
MDEKLLESVIREAVNNKATQLSGDYFNDCTHIPEIIGELTYLERLFIDYSKITELPASIGQLKNLSFFRLWGNNNLKSLPELISGCEKLEYLEVSCADIKELPQSICNLKNLKYLYLNGVSLEFLPNKLPESIVIIDLSSNKLKELPDNLADYKELKRVRLGDNSLKALPVSLCESSINHKIRVDLGGRQNFKRILPDKYKANEDFFIMQGCILPMKSVDEY